MQTKEEIIKKILKELGADVCAIGSIDRFDSAPLGFSPLDLYSDCSSVICFGISLPKGLMSVDSRIIYSHFNGSVICEDIDRIALKASKLIEEKFYCTAVPIPCDAPNDYWDSDNLTAKGLISMKHAAVACGMGQLGKSTLLINPIYGNQLTIGVILTDLILNSDEPAESLCIKGCSICIDACPVSAIKDGKVNQKLCRPHTYKTTARGFSTVECNNCRSMCPMRFGKI